MGELAKYDPMGIDEKERYVIRGRKILKERYPENTGTWIYQPPIPQGWRDIPIMTTTNTTSGYSLTYDPGSTLYRYGSIYRRAEGN